MNKSDSIKELASALALAQGEIENAHKSAANPFFKSKYADLAEVINTLKPVFAKHGLSYTQMPSGMDENGKVTVETMLMHKSGEWLLSSITLPMTGKTDSQAVGSAITYARRYALAAVCGIAQEDDDGNAASAPAPKQVPVRLDPKIVEQINSVDSLDSLKALWEGLSADQHKLYAKVKDNVKNKLLEVTA